MTDNTKYEVTQADEDRAAEFLSRADGDFPELAELFAVHRLTSQPAPSDLVGEVQRARDYVASSIHDRDKSWGDLVRAGERDDCPEMRMVLRAMRTEAALSHQSSDTPSGGQGDHSSEVRNMVPTAPQPDRESVLREALKWYADPVMPYAVTQAEEPRSAVHADGGKRAREALATTTDQSAHSDAVGFDPLECALQWLVDAKHISGATAVQCESAVRAGLGEEA